MESPLTECVGRGRRQWSQPAESFVHPVIGFHVASVHSMPGLEARVLGRNRIGAEPHPSPAASRIPHKPTATRSAPARTPSGSAVSATRMSEV